MNISMLRTRWAAIGAAVAVTIGAGGIGISYATSPAGAAAYVPVTPCRLVDTRPAPDTVGARTSPIGPGEVFTVSAHGANGNCTGPLAIPATATGLQLNVTGVGATTGTFITVWPAGATQPSASSLNPTPGAAVPNAVTTGLSAGGQFSVFNAFGSVNVIVDVVGYYTDHNHDDRYYTKTEVDSKTMFAVVNGAGTPAIVRQSGGVTLFAHTTGENYWLTFPRDVTECAFSATLGGPGVFDNLPATLNRLGIAATQGPQGLFAADPDEVAVTVYEQGTGNLVDSAFSLVVTCP